MENYKVNLLLNYVKKNKQCSLEELKREFKISTATLYRYMDDLVARDCIVKMRGGIAYKPHVESDDGSRQAFQDRVITNRKGKLDASRQAIETVCDGDIIFLDSSTTVYELASLLKTASRDHLTIVTNSISIIQNFRKFPARHVLIALGGNYDAQLNSTLGAATLEQLKSVNLTKAYFSAFGIDGGTVTTNHERQAELIKNVMAIAPKNYMLLDSSKVGRTGLYKLASESAFEKIFIGR